MKMLFYLNAKVFSDGVDYFADERYVNFYIAIEMYFDTSTFCVPLRHVRTIPNVTRDVLIEKNPLHWITFYSSPF